MKKFFMFLMMAAVMQTVSAQCKSDSCCASACKDSTKAVCQVAENGHVCFKALKKIIAQPNAEAVQNLLKKWNYEVVRNGSNSGIYKFGDVSYSGNWAFFPDAKWAGIEYKVVAGKGVTSVKGQFSSKESYEKFIKDIKASDWVAEGEHSNGPALQTDFRNGTKEFINVFAYNNGIYSVIYQVYAL